MLYSRKAAVAVALLFMGWEGWDCWVFTRIVVWRTQSEEIWTESDLQGLSALKENLIDTWAH